MSKDASTPAPALASAPAEAEAVQPAPTSEVKVIEDTNGAKSNGDMEESGSKAVATDAPIAETSNTDQDQDTKDDTQTPAEEVTQDDPSTKEGDIEMADAPPPSDVAPAAAEPATEAPVSISKSKAAKRKSAGVPEHKGKKLNKKGSIAKITHTDAKPGDYFYVRLKGYPLWPAIVCDEEMLPNSLTNSRPVTAADKDGVYREDYKDGGPKAKDRTFPVMYLHTNEFGWIANYDLVDLDFETVGNVESKMRKDLASARQIAAEQNDLQYFKDVISSYMKAKEDDRIAKEAAKAERKIKQAADKKKKKSAKTAEEDDDDVDMTDVMGAPESEEEVHTNKRKAEDSPQRTDSVKKPRQTIKLNTGKSTNGLSTPKAAKESTPKTAKSKNKKATKAAVPEIPKEPEPTAEEKRAKKEKEILFLRHKLQKGLLTRDQAPKEAEMKTMAEFVSKLEGYADLEVSIIRATKINKVLKAILKLPSIPKEEEFTFKARSQSLLDKWNTLLASEQGDANATPAVTNGNSTETKAESEEAKPSPTEVVNGTKESSAEAKTDTKVEEKIVEAESKDVPEKPAEAADAPTEEDTKDAVAEPAAVESNS